MLDPSQEFGLPTIAQIAFDRETQRWLALIPASHYPKTSGTIFDLQNLDAMWAGPLHIPSLSDSIVKETSAVGTERGDEKSIAA